MAYQEGKTMEKSWSKETVKEVLDYPFAEAPERGVTDEVCEMLGIRMTVCEKDGETPTAYYFPYHDQKGEIVGFKKRDMTKDKSERGHFTTVGKVSINCKLFGQELAEQQSRKRRKVIFTEGEWDVAAAITATLEDRKGTKFEGVVPFVVGLSCGTGNCQEATEVNRQFLESFSETCLAFDNDEASEVEKRKKIKKGKEATEIVGVMLVGGTVVKVLKEKFTQKDLCDILLEEGSGPLNDHLSFGFVPFTPEKIVEVSDITFEELVAPRPEGVYIKAFPRLMDKIHGFRKRELVVITAPTGVGKSTCTSEIAFELAEQGHKVGEIYLEEETRETLQRMTARKLEINFNHFKANPLGMVSEDKCREAYEWAKGKFLFLDHFGSLPIEDLMKKIKIFVYQYRVDFIILDHLSMLVGGQDAGKEREALEKVMVELAAFCASNDVGIIAVCHLNRTIIDSFKPPKGKENEPYWVPIKKESMKGASGLEQLSWIILVLEPEILPDRDRGRVRWAVLKNRPWGYLGEADTFKMDDKTGLLIVDLDEEF